jgi:hypothetical protein
MEANTPLQFSAVKLGLGQGVKGEFEEIQPLRVGESGAGISGNFGQHLPGAGEAAGGDEQSPDVSAVTALGGHRICQMSGHEGGNGRAQPWTRLARVAIPAGRFAEASFADQSGPNRHDLLGGALEGYRGDADRDRNSGCANKG